MAQTAFNGYETRSYCYWIQIKDSPIACYRPDISISSDFIVGFPGETDEDFAATIKLIEDIGFDTSFSFIYSARPGTPAAEIPDNVDANTKKNRLQILQQRIQQQASEISRKMVGGTQRLLVTGVSKRTWSTSGTYRE